MQHVQVEPVGPADSTTIQNEGTASQPRLALVGDSLPTIPSSISTQPREEPVTRADLLEAGADALSDAELLALILGAPRASGTTSLDRARDVLAGVGGLRELRRSGVLELLALPGVTPTKAATLVAAMELGRRAASQALGGEPIISSPKDVDTIMRPRLAHLDRENFVVLLLDTKNRVMASPTISVGTLSASLVHPREVFKPAVKVSAASIVLVHNHPSGDATPSREDREVTRRLKAAGEVFGMEVLDHVIIGDAIFSMKERGQF